MIHQTFVRLRSFIPQIVFLLALIGLIGFLQSPRFVEDASLLAIPVTIDFLLLMPLGYLWLIWRTSIPKFTVIPVFVGALALAFFLLPTQFHTPLNWVHTWLLPVVELVVLSIVGRKVYFLSQQVKNQKKAGSLDMYDIFRSACNRVFPGRVGSFLAMELATFYYGFFTWRSPTPNHLQYTSYRKSGMIAVLSMLIGLVLIETFVLHILIAQWSKGTAIFLTLVSIYTGLQIFGFLKSIKRRTIELGDNQLHLKLGVLSEVSINYEEISDLSLYKKDLEEETDIVEFSPLGMLGGGHNILLHLDRTYDLQKLYGFKKSFKALVFWVDEPESFLENVRGRISQVKTIEM
jgi:hypothetical protein